MIKTLFFLIITNNYEINKPSFITFKNYNKTLSINGLKIRESGNYYYNSPTLYSMNIKKGNYVFSHKPYIVYPFYGKCIKNKLQDKLYKPYENMELDKININLKYDSNLIISLNYLVKCNNINYPYFYLLINNNYIYTETTPIVKFYDKLRLSKGNYKFSFGIKNKNNYCGHCPSHNKGMDMGYHFCIVISPIIEIKTNNIRSAILLNNISNNIDPNTNKIFYNNNVIITRIK